MKEIREMLQEARHSIDGYVDCRTPEYAALDRLERAVSLLADRVAASLGSETLRAAESRMSESASSAAAAIGASKGE